MTINMYDSRVMTESLQQLYPPKTWLRDKIYTRSENHTSRYVDIDIVKGERHVAAYVNPKNEGKTVQREGYKTRIYKAPYTKEKMATTAQDFLKREPGQTIYAVNQTSGERAQMQLGKDLRNLGERIDRLEELQCSQGLQTGVVTVEGEDVSDSIDFDLSGAGAKSGSSHLPVLTSTALWSDHTNSTPLVNLTAWSKIIKIDSGLVAGDVICGSDAIQDLVRNAEVKDLLDNRRINMGEIDVQKLNEQGVKYWGYLKDPGVDLWEYVAFYYDKVTETTVPYIGARKVVMYGAGMYAKRHYGAIEDVRAMVVAQRFAKSWIAEDPSARMVMLQSAPLMAPHQTDAIVCGTV